MREDKGVQKIAKLRERHGHLIQSTSTTRIEDLNNVFISSRATGEDVITLSVHTRAERYRPKTSGVDRGISERGEDEEPEENELDALKKVKGLGLPRAKTKDSYRFDQLSEINALKQKLAKENVFCPVQTIQRAILMPEEAPPKALLEGRFPVPGVGLLVNPFAEKKKKKKKKKKKGKKRAK